MRNTIRVLKFYSNNDFSFKDVHNEELFYQNGKILVEVVQLFEQYRIVYPSKHQFLGDLFEQLLSKGFKQNEGQFFTPMPITRFIWDSLPIQDTVHTEKGFSYPKVIDYACGAGHFLTEAVEAINTFAAAGGNNEWVRDHVFGIEKDYRLARVSKISMFMNGAGEANGDPAKKTKLSSFFAKSKYDNINELLDKVIFENRPAAIIVIDEATDELYNVMAQLTMTTEVLEAQAYVCGDKKLHRFSPFKDEVLTDLPADSDADELDTIIVPAREDGFNEEFLKNDRWYAIRISSAMIDKIKYIAAYQVAPISGITYLAVVGCIEKYKDTDKYIVLFKAGTVKKINKVALGQKKGLAPQAPRYSSYQTIVSAMSLDDLWS